MKTSSKAFVWAFSLLGLALVAASCEKFGGGGLRYVRFRAMVQAAGGVRTAYSGVVDDFGYERIDWKQDDEIRLYSDYATNPDDGNHNYADYIISAATPSERASIATVSADIGSGLAYDEDQTQHRFWGIYPSHAMTVSGTGSSATATASGLDLLSPQNVSDRRKTEEIDEVTEEVTHVTYHPDMSKAWMLAEKSGVTESTAFDLLFYPAFTTFEFTLQSQFNKELTVKSFTLSSANTALVGEFSATVSGSASTYTYTCPSASDSNKTIEVSFGTGVSVTQEKSLTFTVLALPREIRKLTIDFLITVDGADVHRTLALTNSNESFESKDQEGYIIFPACQKYKITGLALPSGGLEMSINVNDWVVGANDYNYISDVVSSLKCWPGEQVGGETYGGETYRRYDTDAYYADWDGSRIVVSYGYRNPSGEVIITEDPESFQVTENTLLRPAFSPILELVTDSDPSNVLQLHLDNPNFKFIQYGNSGDLPSGGLDLSVRDHSKTTYLDIVSGYGVKTYFSVVPVKQFTVDANQDEKVCRVSLLSVSPGSLHELSFNLTDGSNPVQALPGEDTNELKFMYVGPSVYATTGHEYDATGTEVTP